MRCKVLCIMVSFILLFSNLGYVTVQAQEIPIEKSNLEESIDIEGETEEPEEPEDVEEPETSKEPEEVETSEEPEEPAEVEEPDEPEIIEDVEELDYSEYHIELEGLRGDNSSWILTDETGYSIVASVEDFAGVEGAEVVWEVLRKTSGEIIEQGVSQSEDGKTITLDGTKFKELELTGEILLVKANVFVDGIDSGVTCSTEVEIKKPTLTLQTDIQGEYEINTVWNYGTKVKVHAENAVYPSGKTKNFTVDKIEVSDQNVLNIEQDSTGKTWKITGVNTGVSYITFYLLDGKTKYQITREIHIVCHHLLTVETQQIDRVISQAKEWLGWKESDGTHKPIIDIYNAHKPLARGYKVKYTDSWCATFVSAVSIKNGYTYLIPTECSCGYMIELFKEKERWIENEDCVPQTGWIIFYDWDDNGKGDNKGWPDHVGIVEKVVGNKITVIEGNYKDSVKRREIFVNGKTIRGYANPDYGKEITRATCSKNGSIKEGCLLCSERTTSKIYAASNIYLPTEDYTYTGKVKSPKPTVKTSKGEIISSGEYYLSGAVSMTKVGIHTLKVNLDGDHYVGSKELSYIIHPNAPEKVTAVLSGGYDDVKVSWTKTEGADGYMVYYKKSTDEIYDECVFTKKTYITKKNLTDGKRYSFKVVPYFEEENEVIESRNSKTVSIYTLKKINAPSVKKETDSTVKVSWKSISGATGYQVSKSLRKGETLLAAETNQSNAEFKATANKTYYYKVRAYKKVNGKNIYGPWSNVVSYKLQ